MHGLPGFTVRSLYSAICLHTNTRTHDERFHIGNVHTKEGQHHHHTHRHAPRDVLQYVRYYIHMVSHFHSEVTLPDSGVSGVRFDLLLAGAILRENIALYSAI